MPVNTGKTVPASAPDRKFITALGRGLDVLRCFGPRDRWLANREIAARTGLARPTISRLVYTLTQIDIRRSVRPLLHALSEQTNCSVHLAINDGLHMQVVDTYWHSAVFVIDIGSQVPVVTTSLGRAYVCALAAEERKVILEQIRMRRPAEWPLAKRRFEDARRDYEQYGFCLGLGDWRRDVNAVAAPFDPRDGTKPVVVGCSGAAFQLSPDRLKRDIGPRLLALVGNLRSALHPE